MQRHRWHIRAAATMTMTAVAAAVGLVVLAPTAPATAATTEAEAPDFASETYGDPWDYANAEDQNTSSTGTPTTVTGGTLRVDLRSGDSVPLVDTTSGSLPYGRDGAVRPIDTGRYTSLSFSMNQPFSTQIGAVYWWTCREKTSACGGGITFPVTAGSKVYDLPLNAGSTLQGKRPWSGKVVALRLDPVVLPAGKTGTASIDWTRLHGTGTPHAAYPPGTTGDATIVARPAPVVDSPNPTQGEDLATTQRGKPWDFTNPANAAGISVENATVIGYDQTGMVARNSGSKLGDSQLHMPVNAFSASKYHNLSFEYTYDGSFSLAESAGGGKMARIIWWDRSSGTPQIGNDMLTFSGVNARRVDIDLNAQSDLDEDALQPRFDWAGATINQFRFDPNEDNGALTWHLKSVHLRADPTAKGSTTITFHDSAWVAGATATVAVQQVGSSTWTDIASNVAVTSGSNAVPFRLGNGLGAGTYRSRVTISHPGAGSQTATAPAVVVMQRDPARDPQGSFDVLTAGAGTATAEGWAYDPDGAPTTVRFYEGATYLGQTTTTRSRPDVQRSHPGAPLATGWSATLGLSPGSHSVCAFAINTGAGDNTNVGCKSVSVRADTSHDPRGSLDTATVSGSTATFAGWAYDADGAPVTVRLYEGATYLGATTTTNPRPDVQRGVPGAPLNTGYRVGVPIGTGKHSVCAFAISVGSGSNTNVGCRTVVR